MKAETLLEAIGLVDGDLVLQAHEAGKPRRTSRRWIIGGVAACLALAVMLPAVMFLHKSNGVYGESDSSDIGTAGLRDYRIYYVDGSALGCISVRLQAAPQERFNAWKDVNHIGDEVEFIEENAEADSYQLTVSDSLRAYYDEGNDLLQQSLGKTMAETEEETYGGFELYLGDSEDLDYANKYDEQGRLVSGIVHYDDGSTSTSEFDYDAGKYTLTRYYAGGGLDFKIIFDINSAGEPDGPSIQYNYGAGGVVESIYEYDENEMLRRATGYYADGSVEYLSEYNERGLDTLTIRYYEDGSIEFRMEAEYDESGQESKHTYYDGDGSVERTEVFLYYDDGNLSTWEVYDADGAQVSYIHYTYDEKGNRLTASEYYPNGGLKHKTEYTYNGGSFYTSRSEYEYDEEGNLIYEWHGGENDGLLAGITD